MTEFRHAISEGIRRDDIVRIVYRGHAHPAAGPVSVGNRFWLNSALKPPVGLRSRGHGDVRARGISSLGKYAIR